MDCIMIGCKERASTEPDREQKLVITFKRRQGKKEVSLVSYPEKYIKPPLCHYHLRMWNGLFDIRYPLHAHSNGGIIAEVRSRMARGNKWLSEYLRVSPSGSSSSSGYV